MGESSYGTNTIVVPQYQLPSAIINMMKAYLPNHFQPGQVQLTEKEKKMISRRDSLLGPAYKLFYQQPIHIIRGKGVWLYDADDKPYLDAYNNVPSVGHCHPRLVKALEMQAGKLNTHTRYLHDGILDYANHLLSTFPKHINNIMLTLSGSEANDLAYRIAKQNTGGTGFIVTNLAYHGGTDAIASLSPSLGNNVNLGTNVRSVPAPDLYRCPDNVGSTLAENVQAAIDDMNRHGIKPAAMIVDTIFSSDGILAEPAGFLQDAVKVVQDAGALFIADEVQAGFGRTGKHWWGFQRHDIKPDIVTMGKGMGGGHPMAGIALRAELLNQLAKSRYFNTTGGNPVSSAVGKTVLEIIENEKLIENADRVGNYIKTAVRMLAERHNIIGDVRGAGLYIGIELVKNRKTKEPATEETLRIINEFRQKRVLISTSGTYANVLKIRPPLPFNKDDADLFLGVLDEVLSAL